MCSRLLSRLGDLITHLLTSKSQLKRMVTLVYIRLTTLIAFLLIVGRTDQPQTLLELIILYIGVCTIFDEDFYQMTSP